MLLSSISALGTFAASLPALYLATRRRYTTTYRLLCLAVLFLGLAKLCRFRPVADPYVEPWLYKLTGVHNIPIGLAASCAIVAYTVVLMAAVAGRTARRTVLFSVLAITTVFWGCFVVGYGDSASGRIASDGLDNPIEALSWLLPLAIIVVVSSAIVVIAVREIRLRPPRSGLGIPHGLLFAGIGGIFYSLNKVVHVGLSTIGAPDILIGAATFIGLIALPLSAIVLAIVVYAPPITEAVNHVWRYKSLRDADNALDRREAWVVARDPQRTHEVLVDTADESLLSARPQTTN